MATFDPAREPLRRSEGTECPPPGLPEKRTDGSRAPSQVKAKLGQARPLRTVDCSVNPTQARVTAERRYEGIRTPSQEAAAGRAQSLTSANCSVGTKSERTTTRRRGGGRPPKVAVAGRAQSSGNAGSSSSGKPMVTTSRVPRTGLERWLAPPCATKETGNCQAQPSTINADCSVSGKSKVMDRRSLLPGAAESSPPEVAGTKTDIGRALPTGVAESSPPMVPGVTKETGNCQAQPSVINADCSVSGKPKVEESRSLFPGVAESSPPEVAGTTTDKRRLGKRSVDIPPPERNPGAKHRCWVYSKANWDAFRAAADAALERVDTERGTVDVAYKEITEAILGAARRTIPKSLPKRNILNIVVLRTHSLKNNDMSTILCSHCIFNILSLAICITRMFHMSIHHVDPAYKGEQYCGNRPLLHDREIFLIISVISFLCGYYVIMIGSYGIKYLTHNGVFVVCLLNKKGVWYIMVAIVGGVLPGLSVLAVYCYLGFLYYHQQLPTRVSYGVKSLIEELTRLVVATNVFFLLTTFPVHLYTATLNGPSRDSKELNFHWMHGDSVIATTILMTNQSFNFVLYYRLGKRFHKETDKIIKQLFTTLSGAESLMRKSVSFFHASDTSRTSKGSSESSMQQLPTELYKELLMTTVSVKVQESFDGSDEHEV
ncbi:hypothetical protein Btru_071567 [Bulinus truncatus]|nr:hypothetical protein Btru_071567 [Bulinus truncatus]